MNYVTLPWFVAAIFFGLFFAAWLALDNRWGNARTDQLDDDLDRHRAAIDDRLERVEEWIAHLDERTRRQAGAIPREVLHPGPIAGSPCTGTDWLAPPGADEPYHAALEPEQPPTQPQQAIPRLVEDVALARTLAEMEDRIYKWRNDKKETAA